MAEANKEAIEQSAKRAELESANVLFAKLSGIKAEMDNAGKLAKSIEALKTTSVFSRSTMFSTEHKEEENMQMSTAARAA